uniref:RNA-guided endonuclease InsQ/TnpB family protein n=1 Tax=Pseudoclavibacter sp. RFBI5 TaxID=2080578 RepID=UPI0035BE25D8
MADGWRTRFNQHRSRRHKYVYGHGDQACCDPLGRVLVPIGSRVSDLSDKDARERYPHLAAMPAYVLQSTERIEKQEWFAAAKRRATNHGKGRKPGRMPRFQSRKHGDSRFVCWFNGGRNATYQQTGRRAGLVIIRGQNPSAAPDGTRRWSLQIRVRHTQQVREYTSVAVNLTRREVAFTSPVAARDHQRSGRSVGIDVGVANTVATSAGSMHSLPDLSNHAADVVRHQKRMAKSRVVARREGRDFHTSARYRAHREAAAKAAAAAANVRIDWAHKLATALVNEHDLIGLEDLRLSNLTRKGKNKRSLNRLMLNAGLGRLRSFVEYKGAAAGIPVVAVNPRNTSRRCRACRHVAAENRESQAIFRCKACGHRAHADTNAAGNILDAAREAVASGAWTTASSTGSAAKTKQAQAGRARAMNRKPAAPWGRPLTAHQR